MFSRTQAINKILALKKRIKVIQGGTWAGKTYGIIPVLMDRAAKNKNETITVTAESVPVLKDGPIKIFKDVMQDTNRWLQNSWNAVDMAYTFSNKTTIRFQSFDSVGKAKAAGKRHRLFINEGNHIKYDIVDALMMRTEKEVIVDFNPDNEFWAHTEVIGRPDAEFIILTYEDNDQIPESILLELDIKIKKAFKDPLGDWNDEKNVLNNYWANWCRVYIKGEIGNLQGVILQNWDQIPELPEDARLIGRGLDFGYNDPTAIIDIYKWNDFRILDENTYQSGMLNQTIATKLDNNVRTYADSAEPKSIAEIQTCGIHAIEGALKGADSVEYGLQVMQGQKYLVTARSINLIKELRGYIRDDKGKPVGTHHAIDATRYHEMMTISQPESWSNILF